MVSWFPGWLLPPPFACLSGSFVGSAGGVAGASLDEAVAVMKRLTVEGACFTIDVLGEEISNMDEVFFLEEHIRAMQAIKQHDLMRTSASITAFALIDPDLGLQNIRKLVQMAAEEDMFVRLDMEDHRVTTDTIEVVTTLHSEGLTNVGTVLQGRLFRTLADIGDLETALGPRADYRICKGIYLEPEDISFTGYQDIVDGTNAAIDRMFEAGAYVGVASHDMPVIEHTLSALKAYGMGPGVEDPRTNAGPTRHHKGPGYEFQMLLGVRGPLRRRLLKEGHRTRVYIPYGEKWYEYSIRRLKENPTIGTKWPKHSSCLGPTGRESLSLLLVGSLA